MTDLEKRVFAIQIASGIVVGNNPADLLAIAKEVYTFISKKKIQE